MPVKTGLLLFAPTMRGFVFWVMLIVAVLYRGWCLEELNSSMCWLAEDHIILWETTHLAVEGSHKEFVIVQCRVSFAFALLAFARPLSQHSKPLCPVWALARELRNVFS
jgi:hypothetical protein